MIPVSFFRISTISSSLTKPVRALGCQFLLACLLCTTALWSDESWFPELVRMPLKEAMAESQLRGKPLLVVFVGTGWSLASNKFQEQILKKPEFIRFAEEELVFYPVYARRKPKLTKHETAVLQSLTIHFDVKGWPTGILLAPDGSEWLRHGYLEISSAQYIDSLRALIP